MAHTSAQACSVDTTSTSIRSDSSLEMPGKQQRPLARDVPPWLLQPDKGSHDARAGSACTRRHERRSRDR